MKHIVDVSEFNLVTNWSLVKQNVEMMIIRMGYRGSIPGKPEFRKITLDKKYREYRNACQNIGIPMSFYWFPTGLTEAEVIEEAEFVAKELNGFKEFAAPVFADSESVPRGIPEFNNMDKATRTHLLSVFVNHLQSKGIPSGIYASTDWLNNRLDMGKLPFSVWVAQYADKCTYKGDYIMWQYTSSQKIPGIDSRVDCSVLNSKGKPISVDTDAKKVIDIALAEVGYLEKRNGNVAFLYDKEANAGSANYTKYGYEMHQIYPAIMDYPAAWCDCFVDWCFMKAYGVSNAKAMIGGDFDDYTVRSVQLYKNKGAYYKNNPKVGDQIFFRNSGGVCHTGLVYSVDSQHVYTVEGNTSSAPGVVANGGCVKLKKYALNNASIDGYGRPNYSVNTSDSKVDKLVTSVKESAGLSTQLDAAEKFNEGVAGSYQVIASALNLRSGAGTNKKIIAAIPNGSIVRCYGYYSILDGVRWLYVVYGALKGFCSEKYLRKV